MQTKKFKKPKVLHKTAFIKTSYKIISKHEFLNFNRKHSSIEETLEQQSFECNNMTNNAQICPQALPIISHMYLK